MLAIRNRLTLSIRLRGAPEKAGKRKGRSAGPENTRNLWYKKQIACRTDDVCICLDFIILSTGTCGKAAFWLQNCSEIHTVSVKSVQLTGQSGQFTA